LPSLDAAIIANPFPVHTGSQFSAAAAGQSLNTKRILKACLSTWSAQGFINYLAQKQYFPQANIRNCLKIGTMPVMECRYCKAKKLHRSRRQGLYEGLVMRLILRGPFRCSACGRRYSQFIIGREYRRREKHESLASFLGMRGREHRLQQALIIILISAFFLAIAIVILFKIT